MFFVRRAAGILPAPFEGGDVITPAVVQGEPFKPTLEQLDGLTVKQVKSFFKCMGFKMSQGTRKEKFLQFALDEWDRSVAHGLTIDRNYNATVEGAPKLLMFKRENSYYMPFMVRAAQVFYEEFFDDMECEQLTLAMLNSLTVAELISLRVNLKYMGYFEKSDGKKMITERMLRAWEFNRERFNEETEDDADNTNSIAMMPDDELSDASSHISDDDMLKIEDYINDVPDEPWECRLFSDDFIEDERDFMTPLEIDLRKHTGEHFLDMTLYDQTITVFRLKDWMVMKFAERTKDGNRPFPTTAFHLACGSGTLDDDMIVADVAKGESKITLKILLRLRGGGIEVRKTQMKVKKSNTRTLATADDEKIFQNAFHCSKVIGSSDNFTLDTLFSQLSLDKMNEALEMVKGKANTTVKLEALAELSPSWVQLEEAATLIENAKMAATLIENAKMVMKEKLSQSILADCSVGSKFKLPELKKKIEIAIGVTKKMSLPSDGGKAFAGVSKSG
eukprot:s2007_g12.t1